MASAVCMSIAFGSSFAKLSTEKLRLMTILFGSDSYLTSGSIGEIGLSTVLLSDRTLLFLVMPLDTSAGRASALLPELDVPDRDDQCGERGTELIWFDRLVDCSKYVVGSCNLLTSESSKGARCSSRMFAFWITIVEGLALRLLAITRPLSSCSAFSFKGEHRDTVISTGETGSSVENDGRIGGGSMIVLFRPLP